MSAQSPQAAPLQPHPRNLLELYRQHRAEIDMLTDETALFLLGFVQHSGTVRAGELSRELNLPMAALNEKINLLKHGKFIAAGAGGLSVTELGRQLLSEIGFIAPPLAGPGEPPKQPEPSGQPKGSKPPRGPEMPKPSGINPVLLLGLVGAGGLFVVLLIGVLIAWWALSEPALGIDTPVPPMPPPVIVASPMPPGIPLTPMRPPPTVGASPTPRVCTVSLLVMREQGNVMRVSWSMSSECPQLTGVLTARYEDRSAPYATYPVNTSSGAVTDRPPTRCPQEGKYRIIYTLVLRDSAGREFPVKMETVEISFIC